MAPQKFYLLGDGPSSAVEIEASSTMEMEELQELVASSFAIVKPEGVGFLDDSNRRLTLASDIIKSNGPVAVSVDGKPVREVPGPSGFPYVGNYLETYPDHLGNHQRLFDQYGPLFVTNNLGSRVYQTNDPELSVIFFAESDFFTKKIIPGHPLHAIKSKEAGVFLGDSDSEEWRVAHKFLPPALGPKAVRHYAPTMQQAVEQAFDVFDELDKNEEAMNVYPYMLKLGSQSVGKLMLGMNFQHFDSVDAPLHEMVHCLAQSLALNKRISTMGSWYAALPFGDPKRLRELSKRITAFIEESIDKASKGHEALELQEAALKAQNVIDYCVRATDNKGKRLPVEQLAPAISVATTAGFSTTASLLSWLIYSLVQYAGMQDRLLQELIDNNWDDETRASAEEVGKLSFLGNFIKEAQRLHNPSFQPARTAKVDMILPGGYRLAKDSIAIPAIHHVHNNSKIWDNPKSFNPDRWDSDKVKKRPQGSYAPFGIGPRSCIGFNFALLQIKIFLTKLVYRYRFTLVEGGPIDYDPYFQLIRPNNLYVRAERRGKWPPKSE